MEEHRKFLADRLLTEERPVTYRILSRALNVHANTAKEMLYDFLQFQNDVKKDSIHATYLIYGQLKAVQEDVQMDGDEPENVDMSDEVRTETLTLTAEESLQKTLAEYESVTSLHVYSLSPFSLKALSSLSDVSNEVTEKAVQDGVKGTVRDYGTIVNPNVRRRGPSSNASVPHKTAQQPVKTQQPPAKPIKKEAPATALKQSAAENSSKDSTPTSSQSKALPARSLKRGASDGIMQSFAKAKAPKTKVVKQEAQVEKEEAALSDDGEADDADFVSTSKKTEKTSSLRTTKKEREDELRRMMEEDDDEDAAEAENDEDKDTDNGHEDPDEQMDDAPALQDEPAAKGPDEPTVVAAVSSDGRRRGKRRVTRKKRILDDQGYMVTINEEGWESFSEDDQPPPSKPQTPSITPTSSAAPKAKKPATKTGQGNIMSFFGKK